MRLTFENFFTNFFLLHHKDPNLDKKDQNSALAYSIAIGILSLGVVHAICAFIEWNITKANADAAKGIGDVAKRSLPKSGGEPKSEKEEESQRGPLPKTPDVPQDIPSDPIKDSNSSDRFPSIPSPPKTPPSVPAAPPIPKNPPSSGIPPKTLPVDPNPIPIHQQLFIKNLASKMSKEEAIKYLKKQGNKGDYIIVGWGEEWVKDASKIFYVDNENCIRETQTFHHGNHFYDFQEYIAASSLNALTILKNPIHPGLSGDEKNKIQGALKDFYYLNTIKYLNLSVKKRCEGHEFNGLDVPLDLSGLLKWLEALPEKNKKEELASMVFPFFAKAYGHVFGVNGSVNIDGKDIKLEGLFSDLGKTLVGSFQDAHLQDTDLLTSEEKKEFKNFINKNCSYDANSYTDSEEVAAKMHKDILKGGIVSIATGYSQEDEGHSTNITISKEFICYTNRGDRYAPDGKPLRKAGTFIWKIKDVSKLTPETIASYFKQAATADETKLIRAIGEGMETGLLEEAQFQKYQTFSDQRVGNCSFVNNVTNSWSTAFIFHYRKNHNWDEATAFASNFYREMRIHNKTAMQDYWKRLQSILPEVRKKDHFDIFRILNRLIFEKHLNSKKKPEKIDREEKYKKMYGLVHEMMLECSIPLMDVLSGRRRISLGHMKAYPSGTFCFFDCEKDNMNDYMVVINVSSQKTKEVTVYLNKDTSAEIKIFPQSGYPKSVYCDLVTIGDLVKKVKEKTGEELRFVL